MWGYEANKLFCHIQECAMCAFTFPQILLSAQLFHIQTVWEESKSCACLYLTCRSHCGHIIIARIVTWTAQSHIVCTRKRYWLVESLINDSIIKMEVVHPFKGWERNAPLDSTLAVSSNASGVKYLLKVVWTEIDGSTLGQKVLVGVHPAQRSYWPPSGSLFETQASLS